MGAQFDGDGSFRSEINVTPLVDVVLVLLIIFMVVIPLTLRGYDVDIPGESVEATTVETLAEQTVLGIRLQECPALEPPDGAGLPAGCNVHVNEVEIPVSELPFHMAEAFESRRPEDRVLFLSADERLNYEAVMRIVDLAKSGVPELRIGLVTAAAGEG